MEKLRITEDRLSSAALSDDFGSDTSIPKLPQESASPDTEMFDSVRKETPDVPIAVPESMEINVSEIVTGEDTNLNTQSPASSVKAVVKHAMTKATVQTKTSRMKKTDKGIGELYILVLYKVGVKCIIIGQLCKNYITLLIIFFFF